MSNDKTKWIFDDEPFDPDKSGGNDMTETLGGDVAADPTFVGSDEPTIMVDGPGGAVSPAASDKTEIYSGGRTVGKAEATGFDEATDPVTGWLVVIQGPGLGNSIQIGSGMNNVGRGAEANVSLPFGDRLISSDDHVRIIYDDTERKFFIAHGSSRNLSRVNGQMLANTLPLENNAIVELSKVTTVVFKSFCSESFDWSDVATGDASDG